MILKMPKAELSITVLHMSNMRKEVRKGFKRMYSKDEYKEKMQLFDDAKNVLENALDDVEEEQDLVAIHLTMPELEFLNAFLEWYLSKLTTIDTVGSDGKKQIELLNNTCQELKNAVVAYA